MSSKRPKETKLQRHFQARLHQKRVSTLPEEYLEAEAIKVLDHCRKELTDKFGEPISDRDIAVLVLVEFGKKIDANWQPERGSDTQLVHKLLKISRTLERQARRIEKIDFTSIKRDNPDFDEKGWQEDNFSISSLLNTSNLSGDSVKFDPSEWSDDE